MADQTKNTYFKFANIIADLFAQYLVFRPDWLEKWQHGELIDGLSEAQLWQATLWQELIAETASNGESLWQIANLYQRFIQTKH